MATPPDHSPASDPGAHLPFPLRAWLYLTRPALLLGATGLISLALLGAGAALLLPPPNLARELPDESALGTLATRSIKANRDYAVPDPQATEAQRRSAASSVRPVYDFDPAPLDDAARRLEEAFASARQALADEEAATKERKPKPRRELGPVAPPTREGYAEFVKRLQAVVDEGLYAGLESQRFSVTLERTALALLRASQSEEVLKAHELVLAERNRGITIRQLGTASRVERDVLEVDRIGDLDRLRDDLALVATGATTDRDARAARWALALPADSTPEVRGLAARLVSVLAAPNLEYNSNETSLRRAAASAAVKPVVLQYSRGERVLADGERIETRHLVVLRYMAEQARTLDEVQIRVGAALFAMLLASAVFALARRTLTRFRPGKRDLLFLTVVLLGNLGLVRAAISGAESLRDAFPWLVPELAVLLAPLTAGSLLVRTLRSGESSVVFAFTFAPLVAVLTNGHIPSAIGLVASLVAADRLGRREGSLAMPWASVESGLAAAICTIALGAFQGRPVTAELGWQALGGLAGAAIVSPLVAVVLAPVFETLFGYTTEAQLSRLANLNHTALKDLIIRAPGTYHHSLIVGALAEAAARQVGANPLLARVGGYYHDIGKAHAPLFFGENQRQENRLERLDPASAMEVLREHVSIGVTRGRELHLPQVVLDVIAQHHGTRVAQGFLARAREEAEQHGTPPPAPEQFRYPGPRPRSREAALVLLADAVEAAARSLTDASPERLRASVPRVVEPILLEGQLDECDLTLADVRATIAAMQEVIVDLVDLPRVEPLVPPAPPRPSPDGPVLRVLK